MARTKLDLICPSLRKQKAEIFQKQTAQRRAADHADHLKRSAELFAQFESIRVSAPQLGPGQVLDRIGVADQADLLRSLLLASAQNAKPATLWVVAGTSLIRIDAGQKPTMVPMPDELGPFRSVNSDGQNGLLIGCRQGILSDKKDSPSYRDPQVTSQLGFNAAIATPGRIWATHGEAGLASWSIDQPQQPDITIRPSAAPVASFAPRNLVSFGNDRLFLSSGGQLLSVNGQGEMKLFGPAQKSDVAAIFVQPQRLLAVYEDGTICSLSPEDGSILDQQRRSGRVTAAAALPWLGDLRLLLAGDFGPIMCIGPDDELTTQYASAHLGPRIVAGAAHAVAAVTSDRQRLLLWNSWEGRQPQSELHLYSLARHRIADIAFA